MLMSLGRKNGLMWRQQQQQQQQQSWIHKETIDISSTAQFVPHQEIWPKNGSCTLNKWWWGQVALTRRSARFCEIRSESFYLVFEPHMHTNRKPAWLLVLFCFQTSYDRFLHVFGSFCRSYLLTKPQKGRRSDCWSVHDQYRVKKSHPNTSKFERGIACLLYTSPSPRD